MHTLVVHLTFQAHQDITLGMLLNLHTLPILVLFVFVIHAYDCPTFFCVFICNPTFKVVSVNSLNISWASCMSSTKHKLFNLSQSLFIPRFSHYTYLNVYSRMVVKTYVEIVSLPFSNGKVLVEILYMLYIKRLYLNTELVKISENCITLYSIESFKEI